MPGAKQAWPMVAACWSPAMPRIGTAAPRIEGSVSPYDGIAVAHLRQDRARHAEQGAAGRRRRRPCGCRRAACARRWWHRWRARGRRSGARAGSCRWCRTRGARPAPACARRRRGRAARRSWWPRNRDRAAARSWPSPSGSCPAALSLRQVSAVRRSCQTMALWIGRPVRRSHSTQVSRWLVMPMAAMSPALSPAAASAWRAVSTVVRQMSSGSCSTQPSAGKCWANSRWARPRTRQVRAEHDGAARRGALIDRQDVAGVAHASSQILACYCGPMSCALRAPARPVGRPRPVLAVTMRADVRPPAVTICLRLHC